MSFKLGLSDLKGDVISRSRRYLTKVAGVPEIDPVVWQSIDDLSKVRNCIVHTLGNVELTNDRDRLNTLVIQGVGLSIGDKGYSEPGTLIISDGYCASAIVTVEKFFKRVFEAADLGPAIDMS